MPSLQPEVAYSWLVPSEVVGHLVPQRALHLSAQQLGVVPEVALEGVLVEHDAVGVVARATVSPK